LFLDTDLVAETVLLWTAKSEKLEILQNLRVWAKEKLTAEEINRCILERDQKGRTVLFKAAKLYKLEILQKLLEWAK